MTWTRQRRQLERAERELAPYRRARLERDLEAFYLSGEPCVVSLRGLLGAAGGVITELETGRRLMIESTGYSTNVPWSKITGVRAATP